MEGETPTPKKMIARIGSVISDMVTGFLQVLLWAISILVQVFVLFARIIVRTVKVIMFYIPKMIAPAIPKKTSSSLNQQLIYAGVEMTSEEVISVTLVYSIVVTIVAYLAASILAASNFIIVSVIVVAFCSVWALPFILLSILTNSRSDAVESVLPDVLSIVGQNMSAGMTSYNALWSAARPEFGPLAMEIQDVAKATLTGIPLTDALVGMTNHVKSAKLARSVRLIIQGMKSGGELPEVLQAISRDMRMEQNLKKQMAAETNAHAIFILFAIMVGAPLLFAVSLQFITIFSTMMSHLNVEELAGNMPQQGGMVALSPLSISPEFFQMYTIGILFLSSLSGALLVGMLRSGNATSGVLSIPVFVVISIGIFMAMKYLLGGFFSQMIMF